MGFKLSDIIPNHTWFYNLNHSPSNTHCNSSTSSPKPRKSYYFTRNLTPTKSSPISSDTPTHHKPYHLPPTSDSHHLPPIITRPKKFKQPESRRSSDSNDGSGTVKATRKEKKSVASRKYAGVKLRVNSPRIVSRREIEKELVRRRRLCDSFAIVKSSFDPQKDFRESMVEMIVENNIRASKDLEDLLACYLSLNSDQYHNLIIKVFKQIWFDLKQLDRFN